MHRVGLPVPVLTSARLNLFHRAIGFFPVEMAPAIAGKLLRKSNDVD
jgi:hypothetical protein